MTHELPGNPWVDYFIHNTRQASAALHGDHIEGSERLSQEALGNAVLALAYEQRTAALIALFNIPDDGSIPGIDYAEAARQINARLGLGESND